jgi:hypothetical protein
MRQYHTPGVSISGRPGHVAQFSTLCSFLSFLSYLLEDNQLISLHSIRSLKV